MKYCICQDAWRYFKIVDMDVERYRLNIKMQRYGGARRVLLEISRSCDMPKYLNETNFEFSANEHVKIEVKGGKITLIGVSHAGSTPTKIDNSFLYNCPFSDFDKA